MRKLKVLFILLVSSSLAFGYFERANYSARDIALAESLLTADDIYAIYANPAGLGLATKIEVMANFDVPYAGLEGLDFFNMNAGFLVPLPLFFKIPGTVAWNISFFKSPYHQEMKITTGYGVFIRNLFGTGIKLALGGNFHIYGVKISTEDLYVSSNPLFGTYGNSRFVVDFDIGGIFYFSDRFQVAVAWSSIIRPDINIFQTEADGYAKEPLPGAIKIGGSWKFPTFLIFEDSQVSFSYNIVSSPDEVRKADPEFHFGYEFHQFNEILAVRMGYKTDFQKGGLSELGAGVGIGMNINGHEARFDYAFGVPIHASSSGGIDPGAGNHQFSILYKWNLPKYRLADDEQERSELKEEYVKEKMMNEFNKTLRKKIKALDKEKEAAEKEKGDSAEEEVEAGDVPAETESTDATADEAGITEEETADKTETE